MRAIFWDNYQKFGAGSIPKEVIATKTGKSRATAYRWVHGREDLKMSDYFLLCQAVNIDFFSMIGIFESPEPCRTTLEVFRNLLETDMSIKDFGRLKFLSIQTMILLAYSDFENFKEVVNERHRERD